LALIDTGALITGLSNRAVAEFLLDAGLSVCKGVVFLDEYDRQMVLLRKGKKVVKLADCGLALNERFSFYDHVHTTGMDIKQAVDARAALTLGKDMVFRDYAQGAFRMRGIGKGQTIHLVVTPEVLDLIVKNVAIGTKGRFVASVDQIPNLLLQLKTSAEEEQFLRNVLSWLILNSMKVDSVQYNLLCEQNVANIWRKICFNFLLKNYHDMENIERLPPHVSRSLQVFRERLDFEIENSIPIDVRYSEKILQIINEHAYVLSSRKFYLI
jgi:hypothetical protein